DDGCRLAALCAVVEDALALWVVLLYQWGRFAAPAVRIVKLCVLGHACRLLVNDAVVNWLATGAGFLDCCHWFAVGIKQRCDCRAAFCKMRKCRMRNWHASVAQGF